MTVAAKRELNHFKKVNEVKTRRDDWCKEHGELGIDRMTPLSARLPDCNQFLNVAETKTASDTDSEDK